jgi:hypothetical protein
MYEVMLCRASQFNYLDYRKQRCVPASFYDRASSQSKYRARPYADPEFPHGSAQVSVVIRRCLRVGSVKAACDRVWR